jgi:CelD/BcsL family acetyltransferase involved in cellulose biosynthesis
MVDAWKRRHRDRTGRPHRENSTTIFETHRSFEPLAADWDGLADRVGASPFERPGWIGAWWRAFGAGSLEICALRRDGRLAAVLPLRRHHGALASTTNWHTPEFGPLAEDDLALAHLLSDLFGLAARRVSLAFVDSATDAVAEAGRAAAKRGYRVHGRTIMRSPFLDTAGRDWTTYERSLSGNVRGDSRRRLRRLRDAGDLTVDVRDGSERLDELLADGFRIEAAGWKGARGTAIQSQPETLSFYSDVARWAAERGSLRLAYLRLDGRAIAFHFCLEEAGVHYFLKGGHDPELAAFSPGKILTYEMLRRAFTLGLRSYEFLGGADPWKLQWAQTCHERSVFHAFRGSLAGSLEWSAIAYGRPVARALRRSRPLSLLRR